MIAEDIGKYKFERGYNMKEGKTKDKNHLLFSISNIIISLLKVAGFILLFIIGLCFLSQFDDGATGWEGLGYGLVGAFIIIVIFAALPLLLASIFALRYCKGKGKLLPSWCFAIISLVIEIIASWLICRELIGSFETQTTYGYNYFGYIIFSFIITAIFCAPSIVFLIACFKAQFADKINMKRLLKVIVTVAILTVILLISIFTYIDIKENEGVEKIPAKEENLPTLADFEKELKSRGLIQEGRVFFSPDRFSAEDSKYEYDYRLNLEDDANERYPLFRYESYVSLIQKGDKTEPYYKIGPGDWCIEWDIYYVNGQIYAVNRNEDRLNKSWSVDLFGTKYGRIISEEDKITTYNRFGNYFVYGGGIEKGRKGQSTRYLSTLMVNKPNEQCVPVVKVENLNAETLDTIAKEMSPQYWLEYGK